MATSPIYSWPEPDNTDLVKNGALAIRTLGNAIDTTMATMTPKSIVDAKGDIIAASSNDTPARLAVGNNGETLVADSSTSTGLRYQGSMTAGKNAIINGGFDIWQRGTSITAVSTYCADRWYKGGNGAQTISRQATGDTTNLPFIQYCARVQRNSGNSTTTLCDFGSNVETINAIPYAGKAITMSYYARAGANYSAASSQMNASLYTGTGTDQNAFAGYTGVAQPINTNVTLTTTWQRFQHTITLGATVTEFMPYFAFSPTGTAGANDYFEVTGVQLEVGSVATPFSRAGGTIQGELAACQRYFYKTYPQSVTPGTATNFIGSATGTALTTAAMITPVRYANTMRATPTITIYHQDGTVNAVYYILTAAKVTVTGAAYISDGGFWQIDAASTLTANAVYYWHYTASAEL